MRAVALLLALTFFCFAAGCATHTEIVMNEMNANAKPYVGKHSDILKLKRGGPDTVTTLSTGEEVWTYKIRRSGEKKGFGFVNEVGDRPMITWVEVSNYIVGTDAIIKDVTLTIE